MTKVVDGRTVAFLLLAMFAGGSAQAATFRCGNVYQDKPCEGKEAQTQLVPGKVKDDSRPSPTCPSVRKRLDQVNAESRVANLDANTKDQLRKRRVEVDKEIAEGRC